MMRRIFFLLILAVSFSAVASAQTIKLARVNSQEIIALLPEADSVRIKLEARQGELTEQIEYMQSELQRKYAAYQKDKANLSGIIAQQREQDIVDLQEKLQNFSREADSELQAYQQQLTTPIFEKVQAAIDKVSKLNLATIVIDESAQTAFLYYDKSAFTDLTPAVKKELNITK